MAEVSSQFIPSPSTQTKPSKPVDDRRAGEHLLGRREQVAMSASLIGPWRLRPGARPR